LQRSAQSYGPRLPRTPVQLYEREGMSHCDTLFDLLFKCKDPSSPRKFDIQSFMRASFIGPLVSCLSILAGAVLFVFASVSNSVGVASFLFKTRNLDIEPGEVSFGFWQACSSGSFSGTLTDEQCSHLDASCKACVSVGCVTINQQCTEFQAARAITVATSIFFILTFFSSLVSLFYKNWSWGHDATIVLCVVAVIMGITSLSLITDVLFQRENGTSYKWGVSYVCLGVGILAAVFALAVLGFGRCLAVTRPDAGPPPVSEEGQPQSNV